MIVVQQQRGGDNRVGITDFTALMAAIPTGILALAKLIEAIAKLIEAITKLESIGKDK
jgi:hypothetical protein